MTSLVAWVGVDDRAAASLNIATDSRISWDARRGWNYGRKAFASRSTPDIFGYVGDVSFAVTFLSQVVDALEAGLAPSDAATRFAWFQAWAQNAFFTLPPNNQPGVLFVYGTRENSGMASEFRMWTLELSSRGANPTALPTPARSSVLTLEGSGQAAIARWHARWESSSQGGTSRAIFSAFCDALSEGSDSLSGGAPQLVGLYRIRAGQTFGVIHEGKAWFNGAAPADIAVAQTLPIEWRNRLFERCDANGVLLPTAQRHHSPRGLGGKVRRG